MVNPLSYFLFQPVFYNWCMKHSVRLENIQKSFPQNPGQGLLVASREASHAIVCTAVLWFILAGKEK